MDSKRGELNLRIIYIGYNALFSLILFFLNGQLGKLQYGISEPLFEYGKFTFESSCKHNFSGNFFQKIVNPTVYLAVIAASTQYFLTVDYVESLWLLIPMFWLYRLMYMIWRNVFIFLNLKYEAIAFILSLLLGEGTFFYILLPLLHKEETIWISVTALRDALWYAILAYIFKTLWDIMRKSFEGQNLYPDTRRREIVMNRYDRFSNKYGDYIRESVFNASNGILSSDVQEQVIFLVYAIMIYEDYNRPITMRIVEWLVKATIFRCRTMSLGIMQVRTNQLVFDKKSIGLAIPRIIDPFLTAENSPICVAISQYNAGDEYKIEVNAIYNILTEVIPCEREAPTNNDIYKI